MVMVLMKVKNRCCGNRTVRGLEDEHAQVRDSGQICPVQRCVVLGNGTIQGPGGVAKVQCSEITEVNKPLTDRGAENNSNLLLFPSRVSWEVLLPGRISARHG